MCHFVFCGRPASAVSEHAWGARAVPNSQLRGRCAEAPPLSPHVEADGEDRNRQNQKAHWEFGYGRYHCEKLGAA